MGFLTVFSETGGPHSGCLLEYAGDFEWLSYMPSADSSLSVLGSTGYIDATSRETAIDTYVRLKVSDEVLIKGRNQTVKAYLETEMYRLFINDCCSFSKDLSRNCGLNIPLTAFLPGILVIELYSKNFNKIANYNDNPYPWRLNGQVKALQKVKE